MAETPKQSEQSMEEILQSIKRIIAEEGDDTVMASNVDDVLELTDRVPDEATTTNGDGAAPISVDALLDSLADPAHVAPAAAEREVVAPELESFIVDAPEPVAEQKPLQPETISALEALEGVMAQEATSVLEDGIASQQTVAAASAALKQLAPAPQEHGEYRADRIAFRSGTTVEDLVLEALRPMLREWVDSNLPGMVERLVAREISKIRNQM